MHSGHLCLNLTENVGYEDFPKFALALLRHIGGAKSSENHSPGTSILKFVFEEVGLRLVYDDYPEMISIEASCAKGDEAALAIKKILEANSDIDF